MTKQLLCWIPSENFILNLAVCADHLEDSGGMKQWQLWWLIQIVTARYCRILIYMAKSSWVFCSEKIETFSGCVASGTGPSAYSAWMCKATRISWWLSALWNCQEKVRKILIVLSVHMDVSVFVHVHAWPNLQLHSAKCILDLKHFQCWVSLHLLLTRECIDSSG